MKSRFKDLAATKSLNLLTAKPRCRRDDALRRVLSPRPSPEAKTAIAKRFKALRRKAHITQKKLGDIIGICRQAVNEIENRRVYPHYTTLDKFSDLEAKHMPDSTMGPSELVRSFLALLDSRTPQPW